MKNIKALMLALCVLVAGSVLNACKKEKTEAKTDLLYDVEVDGNQVKFTVKTEGVSGQKWDFGDGETSDEANPTHTYPGKGKYVPTLTASVNGASTEASTVLRIAKSTPVKLNDNSLADWDAVTKDVIPLGASKGIFNKVKLDYDGNYVYLYAEMVAKKSDGVIFDFYIDADNNPATGLLTGTFADGGYDILLEGPLLDKVFDTYYFIGDDQNNFGNYTVQSIAEAYTLGTVKEEGGVVKFEARFARGKLKGLTGTGMRIGIQAIKNDWSETLGNAPDEEASSYFLDMSE
jgi:hypothetical protein